MKLYYKIILFNLISILITAPAIAADKTSLQQSIPLKEGKIVRLQANNQEFLSAFNATKSKKQYGTILLLHDWAGSFNEPNLIGPLRRLFPKFSWATLSINLAYTDKKNNDSNMKNNLARIQAAIDYLKKQNTPVVLLGYGAGGKVAMQFVLQQSKSTLKNLILVSVDMDISEKTVKEKLSKLELPILDIIAAHDYSGVTKTSRERQQFMRNKNYRHIKIIAANHYYNHLQRILTQHIIGWLKSTNT